MKTFIKEARLKKGITIREVAQQLAIDPALVSKFENGSRKPTRDQVLKLARVLEIDAQTLLVSWLKERILYEIGSDDLALQAMLAAETEIRYRQTKSVPTAPSALRPILKKIDTLKKKLDKLRHLDSYRIAQALELEYTFESNRIEGNTLTLKETDLVINEGLTISGKSMREHLEAINHQEAISYVKELIHKRAELHERELLTIHNLILRGIEPRLAGKYRDVQVMIKGSSHQPPAPFLVRKQMEDFFVWYQSNKNKLHPVVLAASLHERLVTIHPFIDGNGRTSRLIMNLILLRHGYVIANIKGDYQSRMNYYQSLEQAQTQNNPTLFQLLVAETELQSLQRYLDIVGG